MSFLDRLKKRKEPRIDQKFGRDIFRRVMYLNLFYELLTVIYCILLGNITMEKMMFTIISGFLICLVLNYIFNSTTISLFSRSIQDDLESFYCYETTEKERTKLLKRLMSLPNTVSMNVFMVYLFCSVGWLVLLSYVAQLDFESIILMAAMMYMGAYVSSVVTMTTTAQKVCSKHAMNIVSQGVSKVETEKIQMFGTKSVTITTVHIFVPIILIALFLFLVAWRSYAVKMPTKVVFTRLILVMVVIGGSYCGFATMLFTRMMQSITEMRELLSGINRENLHKVQAVRTDLSNEFMYNIYLVNNIVEILQKILKESMKISVDVINSSNELSVISRETAVTSLQQNSSIKELLSAMEEADALAKNIAEKTSEVSIVAKKTTDNIMGGFDILKQNMQKLDEIKAANDITVDGIKHLTEKITGISDIVRIINSIADQTNIIAFNAELEASRAGEAGENFGHVANEIRRLTNNTIQSTDEIRRRIKEIQHSSDALLISSQNGSKKLIDENQIINELKSRFEELKHSSETMDYSSEEIEKIIDQQTASFAQIVVTLRQISQSTEMFSSSTQKISDSAQNLCTISEKLEKLQPEKSEVKE